mgnify:CR=1 FL=1
MNCNRAKRLSQISLYDLYGLKNIRVTIYNLRSRHFGTIFKLQGVPLYRGARGVFVDLGYTKYNLRSFI